MLNSVSLVGRLIEVPQMQITHGGVKVANAKIQIEKGFKNGLGVYESDYIIVSLWRGIAEMIIDCAKPGTLLAIKGRLHSRNLDCDDNKQLTTIEVIAERVSILDKYFIGD